LTEESMSLTTLYFPYYESEQPLKEVLDALKKNEGENFQLILVNESKLELDIDFKEYSFVKIASWSGLTRAVGFNKAIKEFGGDFFAPLPPEIIPHPEFIEMYRAAFDSETAMVFSDYILKEGTVESKIELFPWEGQVEERFDFGFLKMFSVEKMKEIGFFDETLEIMEEYDLWLKLTDKNKIKKVDSAVYTALKREKQQADDDLSKRLFSPGGKGLGQFSYLFYPEQMEKEVKEVFYQTLKRRKAFLTNETVEVDYSGKNYELLASVVIPVFNRTKYIGNAIEKVLAGTFQDFEVIVIDNGSTDGTQDVVRGITDSRVKLIENNGKCIADALNRGIREARGKYICQLDSDDEYAPDTLEKMIGHLETHPKCGLAISYYELMDEQGNLLPELGMIEHLEYDRNNIIRVDGAGALRVFPKAVLEEFGLYDEENYGNFGEDYDMVLKVSEKYDVDRVHYPLYRYRRHSDNTDVTRDPYMKVRNKLNARLDALRRRKKINGCSCCC